MKADSIERAVEHRDPHALMLTAACIDEDAVRSDPVYRLAAQRTFDHLPAW